MDIPCLGGDGLKEISQQVITIEMVELCETELTEKVSLCVQEPHAALGNETEIVPAGGSPARGRSC